MADPVLVGGDTWKEVICNVYPFSECRLFEVPVGSLAPTKAWDDFLETWDLENLIPEITYIDLQDIKKMDYVWT